MFPLPSIQIRQQYARIGMDIEDGRMEIRQPKATLEQTTSPARLEMEYRDGDLTIDQSKAWDALAMGSVSRLNDRIYSQAKNIVLQNIARIVENGNRMAAIHKGGNPIADIAAEQAFEDNPLVYVGEASYDNVDIEYVANEPDIQYTPAHVNTTIQAQRPEIYYQRGSVSVYLAQRNSLEIIPPQLDYKL
jgi:hypothetical protein